MPTKIVGQSLPRIDALGKVTGETPYPGDLSMEGMLHMKILFAGRPHARVKRINLDKAQEYIDRHNARKEALKALRNDVAANEG